MLLSFSVENFKSIRDLQTLSLEAGADDHLEETNVITMGKRRLLRSAALFGPNASGKSNVIGAMRWFREFVLDSSKQGQVTQSIDVTPFLLSTETEKAPTHFEVEFLWQEFHYRYGFEVTQTAVVSEWLFRRRGTAKEAKLFMRDGNGFDRSSEHFKEGKGLEERTRKNALFLSVCAQFNGPVASDVLGWMSRLRHLSGLSEAGFFALTAKMLEDPKQREKLLRMAQRADLSICELRSEMGDLSEDQVALLPSKLRQLQLKSKGELLRRANIKTAHPKLDAAGASVGTVEFDLRENESQGTQKFIALSGPLVKTLDEGSILVVDELEARLHPLLTQAILEAFHGPTNKKNAQLIFATHDVLLMDPERMRRDQTWFCEKDEQGATDLYSLADFDTSQVRPTTKFSRQYLLGIFGAIPKLAHFKEAVAHGA